ncbi:Putative FAD-dependent oxidoreductase LodB [Rubripirellula lacrimiformis]|uniref:FAD-dependent oxidoreductase LodB n=1 Tax=Rubripirellula lacrimiformis TaxID=1930273 RepID=A0A517N7I9_9BACT|nr:Putative FAD-dependent oxidoreductase LodB [Rubripirellula lacrimiformis]
MGGGPAGCAMALRLMQNGCTPTILERSSFSTSRVGEALLPEAEGLLKTLDVWDQFKREDFEPTSGIVSAWGSDKTAVSSFLFQPFSQGWNLDRAHFDRMLLCECAGRGCHVDRPAGPMRVSKSGTVWNVQIGSKSYQADILVDATGRSASIATRLGATRVPGNRLMALVGYMRTSDLDDPRLLIESAPSGWWYSAGLPNDQLVVAYLTDADLIPRHVNERTDWWRHLVRRLPHTSQRIEATSLLEPLRLVNANTSWLDESSGEGWIAIGDAAISLDPLSGNGIIRALKTGIAAAESVVSERSDFATSRFFGDLIHSLARESTEQSRLTHQRETRWEDQVFWQRRTSVDSEPKNCRNLHSIKSSFENGIA